jgi:ribosomal protein L29
VVDAAVTAPSPAKRKQADREEDSDHGDGGGETETPAAKLQRISKIRAKRSANVAERWSSQDPRMAPFLNQPPLLIDLHRPKTKQELTTVEKMAAFWIYCVEQGVFLPNQHNATWQNMPVEAKVFAFLAMRERGILLNVEQFNLKAQARLCKLRQNAKHKSFRADFHHRAFVYMMASSLWTSFREGDPDEEPVHVEAEASTQLDDANAELVSLRAQLAAATRPQPNSSRKLLFSLPLLMIAINIIPA